MTLTAKGRRILYVSQKAVFFGGVERFIYDTTKALNRHGFVVYGMFAEQAKEFESFCAPFRDVYSFKDQDVCLELSYDAVFIHKLSDFKLLRKLNSKFKTIVYVHDHDYYCRRRHKYLPFKRINCSWPDNLAYCSFCSMLTKDSVGKLKFSWNRNYSKVLREIRRCRCFAVMSEYMRDNLIMNGFQRDDISKIYPIIDAGCCC